MIQIKATAVCISGTKHPLSVHGPLPIKLNISSQRACHCLPFLLPGNSGMPFPVCHEVSAPHLGNGSRKELLEQSQEGLWIISFPGNKWDWAGEVQGSIFYMSESQSLCLPPAPLICPSWWTRLGASRSYAGLFRLGPASDPIVLHHLFNTVLLSHSLLSSGDLLCVGPSSGILYYSLTRVCI